MKRLPSTLVMALGSFSDLPFFGAITTHGQSFLWQNRDTSSSPELERLILAFCIATGLPQSWQLFTFVLLGQLDLKLDIVQRNVSS